MAVPNSVVALPRPREDLAVIDDDPDRGAFWRAVIAERLDIYLDLAIEIGQDLAIKPRRLRSVARQAQ